MIVAVQQPPRLSVMLIGAGRGSSASAATPGPSSTAPQPSASPGADVDVPFIPKPREAVAEFGFDADLEHVCTPHDMTQQHERIVPATRGRSRPRRAARRAFPQGKMDPERPRPARE